MPIGGFVVTVLPERLDEAKESLSRLNGLEIYGSDDKGNLIVVLDTETSNKMENLVKDIMKVDSVLSVGLTYLNAEDEVEA